MQEALIVVPVAGDDRRFSFANRSAIPAAMKSGVHIGHLGLGEPIVKLAGKWAGPVDKKEDGPAWLCVVM